jgi:hypothetical protein
LAGLAQGLDPTGVASALARAGGLVDRLRALVAEAEAALQAIMSWLLALELLFAHELGQMPRVEPESLPGGRIGWEPLPGERIGLKPLPETGVLPRPGLGAQEGSPWNPWPWIAAMIGLMVAAGVELPVIIKWLEGPGSGSGSTDSSGYSYYTYQQWQARMAANAAYFGGASAGSPPPSPPPRNKGNYLNFKWWIDQKRLQSAAQQKAQQLGVTPQRFEELAYDPAQSGLTAPSINDEAPAAIKAERQGLDGLHPGDLQRGPNPNSGDYIGQNGTTYDVKTPDGNSNFGQLLVRIQKNVNNGQRIIFNTKNLNQQQVQQLQQAVQAKGWTQQEVVGYVNA